MLNLGSDFSLPRDTDRTKIEAQFHQFANCCRSPDWPSASMRSCADLHKRYSTMVLSVHHRQLASVVRRCMRQQLKFEELLACVQEKRQTGLPRWWHAWCIHQANANRFAGCVMTAVMRAWVFPCHSSTLGAVYRSADVMYRHREAIERAMYQRQCELFKHTSNAV